MTIILSDDVGINIKNIRKCRCLTQRELAKLSGINEATIQKYECGTRKPKDENLRKIACALQMDFRLKKVPRLSWNVIWIIFYRIMR